MKKHVFALIVAICMLLAFANLDTRVQGSSTMITVGFTGADSYRGDTIYYADDSGATSGTVTAMANGTKVNNFEFDGSAVIVIKNIEEGSQVTINAEPTAEHMARINGVDQESYTFTAQITPSGMTYINVNVNFVETSQTEKSSVLVNEGYSSVSGTTFSYTNGSLQVAAPSATVTNNNVSFDKGSQVVLTVTPKTNYQATLLLDNKAVTLTNNTYTFTAENETYNADVSFTRSNCISINVFKKINGNVTPATYADIHNSSYGNMIIQYSSDNGSTWNELTSGTEFEGGVYYLPASIEKIQLKAAWNNETSDYLIGVSGNDFPNGIELGNYGNTLTSNTKVISITKGLTTLMISPKSNGQSIPAKSSESSPNTGDTSSKFIWIGLLALSGTIWGFTERKIRKSK